MYLIFEHTFPPGEEYSGPAKQVRSVFADQGKTLYQKFKSVFSRKAKARDPDALAVEIVRSTIEKSVRDYGVVPYRVKIWSRPPTSSEEAEGHRTVYEAEWLVEGTPGDVVNLGAVPAVVAGIVLGVELLIAAVVAVGFAKIAFTVKDTTIGKIAEAPKWIAIAAIAGGAFFIFEKLR